MPRRNRIPFANRERIVRAFVDVNEDYLLVADTLGIITSQTFLATEKTDLGSHGDVELLVLNLHGISSGLQHSSAVIYLSVIVYVPHRASSLAEMCHNPKA